jgi:hypothetical protein
MLWKAHISKQHGCRLKTKDLYVNFSRVHGTSSELYSRTVHTSTMVWKWYKKDAKFKQIVILLNNVIFYAYSLYIPDFSVVKNEDEHST